VSEQSSGEKTEEPTSKKLRDSRDKGQVARSQEIVTTVSLVAVIAYIWFTWDANFARLAALLDHAAGLHGQDFRSSAYREIIFTFYECAAILLPLLGVVAFFAIAANYVQFGSIFSFESVKPKLEKINPAKGLKKIFSGKQLIEMLKSIIKIVLLSTLLFYVIRDAIPSYLNATYCGLTCLSEVTSSVLMTTLIMSALAFVAVAGFDIVYQRRHHHKSLMMTKNEVKRQHKESEGDPIVKGKRKQLAQELIMSDGVGRAQKATALVVNPDHFAVAIEYKPGVTPLPIVVAKGINVYAHQLRATAELAGVPVFRNIPLARSLYADTPVDAFIPDEWFNAIAEILAWVNQNRETLYTAPLRHGVIDMERGDHRASGDAHG
jgi:type III secretion protein U